MPGPSRHANTATAPRTYAQRHGCAWFAGPRATRLDGPVWAAVGGEQASVLPSWKDLPEDVVWWTNLSRPEAWMTGRWASIKDATLLGVDMIQVCNEIGQPLREQDLPAAVSCLSEILARTAYCLSRSTQSNGQDPWDWGQGVLSAELAARWWRGREPEQQPARQLISACCEQVIQPQRLSASSLALLRRVSVSVPRLPHVKALWREPFPAGAWNEVSAQVPTSVSSQTDWIRRHDRPLLLQVAMEGWKAGQVAAGELWVGLRGRRFPGAAPEPVWMTAGEAMELAEFASVRVLAAWAAAGWATMEHLAWPDVSLTDPLADHALLPGLLGWSAFVAACCPADPRARQAPAASPRAVWWRAADRRIQFAAALAMQRAGHAVAAYGAGRVTLLLQTSADLPSLARDLLAAGLLPPASAAAALPPACIDTSDPLQVGHWLRHAKGPETMMDLDRLVAPWPGAMRQVKPVLAATAARLQALGAVDGAGTENTGWRDWWRDVLRQQGALSIERIKPAT